ncbi:hypothetical protein ACWKWP_16995 [Agromyces soli]
MEQRESDGRLGIAIIWVLAVVGSGLVVGLAYGGLGEWFGERGALGPYRALAVVFGVSVLGALLVQLATRRPAGYVARTSASIGGAVVVVALAAIAVAPLAVGASG